MKTPREILLARHQAADAKLDRIRRDVVEEIHNQATETQSQRGGFVSWCLCCLQALCRRLWLELIWPCRRTWAGLAAVWLAILAFNLTQTERAPAIAARSTTSPDAMRLTLAEQQALLTELIGPTPPTSPAAPAPKPNPRPRTERCGVVMMA